MSVVRALVVDDERLARLGIRRQLERVGGVEVVAECADGVEAVRAIRELGPDLVLLDVRMPGMDGFEVVRELGVDAMPPVIFVTAHGEHALRAFEVNAVDYVLKPLEPERFEQAVRRALDIAGGPTPDEVGLAERLRRLLERVEATGGGGDAEAGRSEGVQEGEHPGERGALERLAVEKAGRISFVDVSQVLVAESAGNYVRLFTTSDAYLLRRTLAGLERELDPETFLRVRRSAIVNMERVAHLELGSDGRYRIELDDGRRLRSSRRYARAVRRYIRRYE